MSVYRTIGPLFFVCFFFVFFFFLGGGGGGWGGVGWGSKTKPDGRFVSSVTDKRHHPRDKIMSIELIFASFLYLFADINKTLIVSAL